jgi:hypothetical protein
MGGLRVVNIILSKNPFNPKAHTYKATSAPIFALKFEEKKISATNGLKKTNKLMFRQYFIVMSTISKRRRNEASTLASI